MTNPEVHKVLCIGWHKTGTSSLGVALIELGYTVVGARLDLEEPLRAGNVGAVMDVARQFDAVQDVPWAVLFRDLDREFPGAKFVFTDREDAAWLRSAQRHFGDKHISMHEWIYGEGACVGNEDVYLARFRRHRHEVREYFAERRNDLLELNFAAGDGWDALCEFLGKEIPNKPWPHANKGRHSLNQRELMVDWVRSRTPMSVRRMYTSLRLRILKAIGLPDPRNRFNNFVENRRISSRHEDD